MKLYAFYNNAEIPFHDNPTPAGTGPRKNDEGSFGADTDTSQPRYPW